MGCLLSDSGYTLTIIDDEVALAGGIPTNANIFMNSSFWIMSIIIMAAIVATVYFVRLHYYRVSLVRLRRSINGDIKADRVFGINATKNQIAILEAHLTDKSVGKFAPKI